MSDQLRDETSPTASAARAIRNKLRTAKAERQLQQGSDAMTRITVDEMQAKLDELTAERQHSRND
jgi:hypothetical protein